MSLAQEKAKKIQLLEETRSRRAEIQGQIEGLQDELARERAAKLSGDGKGTKIPALQKSIAKLEEELASLQVDQVLERQIQEIERQEHQELVREAEERRAEAIQALEVALGNYRGARTRLLQTVIQLDEARERARSAHMLWMQLSGTPWSPSSINLYPWDGQQEMAIRILQKAHHDIVEAPEAMRQMIERNPQLFGVPAGMGEREE